MNLRFAIVVILLAACGKDAPAPGSAPSSPPQPGSGQPTPVVPPVIGASPTQGGAEPGVPVVSVGVPDATTAVATADAAATAPSPIAGIDPGLCGLPAFPATLTVPSAADLDRARTLRKEADKLMKKKQYGDAIARFKEELALKPTSSARFEAVRAYAAMGDLERAFSALAQLRVPSCPLCIYRLLRAKEDKDLASLRQDPRFETLVGGLAPSMPDFLRATSALQARLATDLAGVLRESLAAGQGVRIEETVASFDAQRRAMGKPKAASFVVTSEGELAGLPAHPGPPDQPDIACTHNCCKLTYASAQCAAGLTLVCYWPVDGARAVPDVIERRVCQRDGAEVWRVDAPPAVTWEMHPGKGPDTAAPGSALLRTLQVASTAECEKACAGDSACTHFTTGPPAAPAPPAAPGDPASPAATDAPAANVPCSLRSGALALVDAAGTETGSKLLDGLDVAAWLTKEAERYQTPPVLAAPSAPAPQEEESDSAEDDSAEDEEAPAQYEDLSVVDSAITSAIVDKQPADRISTVRIGQYPEVRAWFEFATKEEATVTVVWKRDGTEKARIDLQVFPSKHYRTNAKKKVGPRDAGDWTAEAVDSGGHVYDTLSFEITP